MTLALDLAQRAGADGEVPVGAVLVLGDDVIGQGWNQPIAAHDPTAHAEIAAMRSAAARLQNYRLTNGVLYVTLEPCIMCLGAALNSRIRRLVFGAWDAKAGACGSVVDLSRAAGMPYELDVFGGVFSERSAALLRSFFEDRR